MNITAPREVEIGPACPDDVPVLQLLEQRVFAGDRLSKRSMRHHIVNPSARFLVARRNGNPIGYVLILLRRGTDVARLYSIARDPAVAVAGLGSALLAAAEEAARAAGSTTLVLEVRPDNRSALHLYSRAGYRTFARRADYYEDGSEALRMKKHLGQVSG